MSKITLDADLRSKLNGLNEQMEICDESGQTLGQFLPEEMYKKLLYAAVIAGNPLSKEERERRRQEAGGSSLAEIWKRLGVQ